MVADLVCVPSGLDVVPGDGRVVKLGTVTGVLARAGLAERVKLKSRLIMPLELHVIHAHDFIQVGPHGHFDLAASKAALTDLARACRKRNIDQALLDLRALRPGPKPVFSPTDLVVLVNTFREAGFTERQRLAILYHSDPHHRARLFAFLGTLRGWSVRAFGDFEQAMLWLSSDTAPALKHQHAPGEKKVPLHFAKLDPSPAKPPFAGLAGKRRTALASARKTRMNS